MRKRTNFLIYLLVLMGMFLVFAGSCKKEDDSNASPINPTNGKTTAVFNPDITYGTMTDQDGNVYKTVTIDTQTWMAENLRTTKYNDGTPIPNVTDSVEWAALATGALCKINNTANIDTLATFGCLYNWYAISSQKLAPKGWHVPTDAEWTTLTNAFNGETEAGGKLKEAGLIHWTTPNTEATNETGFTFLPGGGRNIAGKYFGIATYGYCWCATETDESSAYYRGMFFDYKGVGRSYSNKKSGFSVRCVKD